MSALIFFSLRWRLKARVGGIRWFLWPTCHCGLKGYPSTTFSALCYVTQPLGSCLIRLWEVDICHPQVRVSTWSLALLSPLTLKAQALGPDLRCVWDTWCLTATQGGYERLSWVFQMAIVLFSHILNARETCWVVCQVEGEVRLISTLKVSKPPGRAVPCPG